MFEEGFIYYRFISTPYYIKTNCKDILQLHNVLSDNAERIDITYWDGAKFFFAVLSFEFGYVMYFTQIIHQNVLLLLLLLQGW